MADLTLQATDTATLILRCLRTHPARKSLIVSTLVVWISHYLYRVRRVRLHRCLISTAEQYRCHSRLNNILVRCSTLRSVYWPTWFAPTALLQFAVLCWKELRARFLQKSPYERQIITLQDGARLALDWIAPSGAAEGLCSDDEKPVCVLLHGACQDSSSATMMDLASSLACKGLPVVVVNRRGYGGLGMTGAHDSRRLSLYGFDEDLDTALEEVCRKHQCRNVALIGFSCGAGFAARFAAKRPALSAWEGQQKTASSSSGHHARLVCTALLDSAYCVSSCADRVRRPYSWVMNWGLKIWYGLLHRRALQEVSNDFSQAVLRVINPLTSLTRTYSNVQLLSGAKSERDWHDMQQACMIDINVPSLLINSRDDPMARWENVEAHRAVFASNPNLVLAELHVGAHNCKYTFSGAASIADAMIAEFVLSSWHELRLQEDTLGSRAQSSKPESHDKSRDCTLADAEGTDRKLMGA